MMGDLAALLLVASVCAAAVAVPGALVLRALRGRSVTVAVSLLLVITVLSLLAGILGASVEMFLSPHDRNVMLILVGVSGTVGLAVSVWLGRRLTAEAAWREELRERERVMERQRRDLVAWVSHDLRTPLAGMRALSEALVDGVVTSPADVADYHRRIGAESRRMSRLVDDLFELSRIHAGAVTSARSPVSLAEVVAEAFVAVQPLGTARGVAVHCDVDRTQWPIVSGAATELVRVVGNIVGNAVSFSPAGATVWVSAGVRAG
ncbi:sensor histidine kinase, partial [Stackebrandtia soli]|uniref:sensor histidine kinase n=1 Tax=Stackebrandtia soli TaxID=1892856 RepID=UPI0039EAF27F